MARVAVVTGVTRGIGEANSKALKTAGQAYLIDTNQKLAFDPTALYRVKLRVRALTGSSGGLYFGVCGWAANGSTYVNAVGADTTGQQHWVIQNVSVPADEQWRDWETADGRHVDQIAQLRGGKAAGLSPVARQRVEERYEHDIRLLEGVVPASASG